MRLAIATLALTGCWGNVGPGGDWVALEDVAAPLAIESTLDQPVARRLPLLATDTLRVVSYNIDLEKDDVDPHAVAAAIAADPEPARAGLFLMQDCERYPGEGASRVKPIADQLGLRYAFIPARVVDGDPDHLHGLAIMSGYPIDEAFERVLPKVNPNPKIAVAADVHVGAHVLHVIDVHLAVLASSSARVRQLRAAVIDAPPTTLVAGDFNMSWVQWALGGVPVLSASSASEQAPVIDAYMDALGFAVPSRPWGDTSHVLGDQFRLDAFYTRGLTVGAGGVVRVGPSDHWPLWLDVALP